MNLLLLAVACCHALPVEGGDRPHGTLSLTVETAEGRPIAGVEVHRLAFGLKDGSLRSVSPRDADPEQPSAVTDEAGVAAIRYPKSVDGLMSIPEGVSGEVIRFSIPLRKPGFVNGHIGTTKRTEPLNGETTIIPTADGYKASYRMRRGTKLRIETLALDGAAERADCVVVCPKLGRDGGYWRPEEGEGPIETRTLPSGDPYRIMSFTGGLWQYSEWMTVPSTEEEFTDITVVLQAGLPVTGRLSDDMPRPVRDGWVAVYSTQLDPTGGPHNAGSVAVRVEPDGTFRIPSVPRGADVQFAAICDGYVSRPPAAETQARLFERYDWHTDWFNGRFQFPHVVRSEDDPLEVTVPMQPAATVRVRLLDSDGTPVSGMGVLLYVNGLNLSGTFPRFATAWPPDVSRDREVFANRVDDSVQTTDVDGVVEFRNIPPTRPKFHVSETGSRDPRDWLPLVDDEPLQLQPGQTATVDLRLKRVE